MTAHFPADVSMLRTEHRTRIEFLRECNVIDDRITPSRQEIRDAVRRLTPAERKELQRRLMQRGRDLTELMDGDRKRFDDPYLGEDDVADGDEWAWRNR